MAFVFGYSNLVATNGATTAHQVDMTADWIVVDDGSGNTLRVPMTTNINIDKNQSQKSTEPNRRDVAGTVSPTTWQQQWIHIWAIYNPVTNTIAGLFSLSSSSPTLPSGYTHKAYVGATYNNPSGNFGSFSQVDNKVAVVPTTALVGGSSTTTNPWASIDLSAHIPPMAKTVRCYIQTQGTLPIIAHFASSSGGLGEIIHSLGGVTGSGIPTIVGPAELQVQISQMVYYYVNVVSTSTYFNVTGWEY